MRAIVVKWYGPTNHRPSRYRVTDGETVRWYTKQFSTDEFKTVALRFRNEMGWTDRLVEGELKDSTVFVRDTDIPETI